MPSDSAESTSVQYVHSVSEAYRLLPSASRWNSVELDFNIFPTPRISDSIPSKFSKSFDYDLVITSKKNLFRCVSIFVFLVLALLALVLSLHFVPGKHAHHGSLNNYTVPINKALTLFDAQKSGVLPKNSTVKFRGDSGLKDGNTTNVQVDLIGGFYDSGNNVKYSLTIAYTVTLLSWSVIEYNQKYVDIGEIEHVKDIIRWGSDYLLKVGSTTNDTTAENDINCWQRPEDMTYPRPVSVCNNVGSDLAGEIVAALSASSLVFKDDEKAYSVKLSKSAENLFELATGASYKQGRYTADEACGREAQQIYNSSGYLDELVWGGTWLYFATGNVSHLGYVTKHFELAMKEDSIYDGLLDWDNKLTATTVLLARLQYFHDPGYPYEFTLEASANMSDALICTYMFDQIASVTPGGLILLKSGHDAPLQYAAAASFLSKLYYDYLYMMGRSDASCGYEQFSVDLLQSFSLSQVNYIIGDNPMKMSYLVGYTDKFPTHVHHRSASIPWDNQQHSCVEGARWLTSKDPNPNIIIGAMVAGPDKTDNFTDERGMPQFTEPTISGNAGLVAALIALHESPFNSSSLISVNGGIDRTGIFSNIHVELS
ncbi:hypothetical protein GIB67_036090 [Kingdonia uniflora]|uniref:cellulase n=1 Tax=Kingdonia uniflora TaxID=39325 RepID=A0A7J7N9G5_9MAGN|nr:hypothetical protein GIB67_036090 [Kingdonia uniflora]